MVKLAAWAVLVSVAWAQGAPAPFLKRRAKPWPDRVLLAGTWRVVRGSASGKHFPCETEAGQVWCLDVGGASAVEPADGREGWRLEWRIDETAFPRTVDLSFAGGPHRRTALFGIYELEGDKLLIRCARSAASRPKAFVEIDEERGTLQLRLERVRDLPSMHR
ncbi:MAG: TIGR03067 domain-containing protein [Gemmataceae bacterium]|nr:TIGR03067 domain-containing protein [Gemmataceae bacterium]